MQSNSGQQTPDKKYRRAQAGALAVRIIQQEIAEELSGASLEIDPFDDSPDSSFHDLYHENAWDYDYGQSEQDELVEELSVNPWGSLNDTALEPYDGGFGHLYYFMEGVAPVDILHKDAYWVVSKYICMSASVLGGLFSSQFFDDPRSVLLGIFSRDLENRLREFGIAFEIFHGITEEGWKTYKEKYTDQESVAA